MKRRLLITLPYSYNYRNYLLSGFLDSLSDYFQVTVYVDENITLDKFYDHSKLNIVKKSFKRNAVIKILYKLLQELMFFKQKTKTYKYKYRLKPIYIKAFLFVIGDIKWVYALIHKIFLIYNKSKLIKDEISCYDVIISTMAHKPYEINLLLNKSKNTKTFNLVHSWDVITTKGSFLFDYDHSIVWNQTNREEYNIYIKKLFDYSGDVHVCAPIHFDMYNKVQYKKGDYILYATSVERLVENEIEIIDKLHKICLKNNLKLKVRNHPQRSELIFINNNTIQIKTKFDNSRDNTTFITSFYDEIIKDIHSSFTVISIASTIALDGLALRKNVAFLNLKHFSKSIRNYYDYEHLHKLINSCEIPVIESYSELEEYICEISNEKYKSNLTIKDYIDLNDPKSVMLNLICNS